MVNVYAKILQIYYKILLILKIKIKLMEFKKKKNIKNMKKGIFLIFQ